MIRLAIVSPCYNEEEILESSARKLTATLVELASKGKAGPGSFILFVNDGSSDSTWDIISSLHGKDPRIKGISLAHNVGHQNAMVAGMLTARPECDAVVTIDADIQDDLSGIEKMLDAFEAGNEVVYGVKVERSADPFLKRKSAEAFYRLMEKMGVDTVYNHADFRLMSRKVLDAFADYPETNLYLRALVKKIGFKYTTVEDHISSREAGHSKYSPAKMFALAVDGITSFTDKPLYLIMYSGIVFVAISILVLVYTVVSLIMGRAVPGWTSLMLSCWFIGGVILIALGIIGIYLGKTFMESKRRPRYNISDRLF